MNTSATTKPLTAAKPEQFYGRAPGKLILSGEHSVVYGAPALTVAVNRYTDVWFAPMLNHNDSGLCTNFSALTQQQFYSFEDLSNLKAQLDQRFDRFLTGELSVKCILNHPDDLVVYAVLHCLNGLEKNSIPTDVLAGQLSSQSNLPLGAGMGSSAAAIAATFALYDHLLNLPCNNEQRFKQVQVCERLQHGKGSAVDAAAVVYGGLNRIVDGAVNQLLIPGGHSLVEGNNWYWVLHGTPESSTGECVARVRTRYGSDQALWDAFKDCTDQFQKDLQEARNPSQSIQANQRLLEKIGVVTDSVKQLIKSIAEAGGAAKVSGAGSVSGEYGGTVLVYLPDPDVLPVLQQKYNNLSWEPLQVSVQGAAVQRVVTQ